MGPSKAVVGKSRLPRGNGFFTTLPAFRSTLEVLSEGLSVILYGPRHFGLEELALAALDKALGDDVQKMIVRLDAGASGPDGELDFALLWRDLQSQLGTKILETVTDKFDFADRTRKALGQCGKKLVIFLLRGGNRDATARFRKLIETIHELVDSPESRRRTGRSLFIAIDDYLLHYHVQAGDLHTEWYRARWFEVPHLNRAEIEENIGRMAESAEKVNADIAEQFFDLTGGHIGLIHDLLEWARAQELSVGALFEPEFRRQTLKHVEKSTILQWIRRAIDDDTLGLCATALEHRSATIPAEYCSPRIQILRQLGILVWDNTFEARLCGGSLGKMIEAIAKRRAQPKLGTIASVDGMMRFEGKAFTLGDDDICILHLSDLHFGSDFGFRLRAGGRTINGDRLDITSLIKSDLNYLNLAGRIDAVVISGDIACTGVSEEYSRATDAIEELIGALGVDSSHLILVPGNHDMRWNPPELAKREGPRNVSREDFDKFFKGVCRRNPAPAELVWIASRGGKASLAILSLDSNEVESEDAAGIGFVGEDSMREAARLLRESDEMTRAQHLWLVLHHHLTPVTSTSISDARRKTVSVLANAPTVLSFARDVRAEVVLHGHEHQPSITELKWWLGERSLDFGRVASICAGSLSAKRERLGPVSRNQYMILVRRPTELIVRSRIMGDEGISFQSHQDVAIQLLNNRDDEQAI